jgi:hypothetical protein
MGDAPDQGADELDRDHEWRREKERPQQAVSKMGAGLGMRRDAGGVVICRSGHQAGAEQAKDDVTAFARGFAGIGHEAR